MAGEIADHKAHIISFRTSGNLSRHAGIKFIGESRAGNIGVLGESLASVWSLQEAAVYRVEPSSRPAYHGPGRHGPVDGNTAIVSLIGCDHRHLTAGKSN